MKYLAVLLLAFNFGAYSMDEAAGTLEGVAQRHRCKVCQGDATKKCSKCKNARHVSCESQTEGWQEYKADFSFDTNDLVQRLSEYLSVLSKSPDVLYEADILKVNPDGVKEFEDWLKEAAFSVLENGDLIYFFGEKTSSQALLEFSRHRPLILDCKTAMSLSLFLALHDLWGNEQFDHFIDRHGVSASEKRCLCIGSWPPIFAELVYGKTSYKDELPSIEPGNLVYIFGCEAGFAYRNSSELNGFNLLCSKKENGVPYFKGFRSFVDGEITFEELERLMVESYNQPLTIEDFRSIALRGIQKPQKTLRGSKQTNTEIFVEFMSSLDKHFMPALGKMLLSDDEHQAQEELQNWPPVYPPRQEKILGLYATYKIGSSVKDLEMP